MQGRTSAYVRTLYTYVFVDDRKTISDAAPIGCLTVHKVRRRRRRLGITFRALMV